MKPTKAEIYALAAEAEKRVAKFPALSDKYAPIIQAAALLKEMEVQRNERMQKWRDAEAELASIKQQVVFVDEKGWLPFNVNHYIKVKLNDKGKAMHKEWYEGKYGKYDIKYREPEEDAEGWSKWQGWDLMNNFGEFMQLGANVPFETEIMIEVRKPVLVRK